MGDRDEAETLDEGRRTMPVMPAALPRYALGDELGRGGMGEVIDASDGQLGRRVAIKRMRVVDPTERQIERFLREARIQGRLDHPAIVPVHELGRETDGRPFFAMKKLTGRTLAAILDGPDAQRARQRLLRAFADICLAVEFAHARGVIHRDLKPQNVMLGDFGEVYVLDWGVAKVVGEPDGELGDLGGSGPSTQTGAAIGTPGYMSPEQARGEEIDRRSDVYGLGCMLFEILAGVPHVAGRRPSEKAPEREIPPELDDLCAAATAFHRDRRLATARELGERVQRYLDGDRDLAQRQQLATEHLEEGRRAQAAGDRRTAGREAARALALDPTLAGASDLLAQLLLEPPTELPPEVVATIAEDDARTLAANEGQRLRSHIGYGLALPIVLASTPGGYGVALVLALAASAALAWAGARRHYQNPIATAAAHVVILVIAARLYTPLLLAPGLATVYAMMAMLGPHFDSRRKRVALFTVMAGTVLGMFAAEQLGIVSPTLAIGDGAIVMHGLGFGSHAGVILIVCALAALQLGTAVWNASGVRTSERAAKRKLHLLTWQLRQVVPDLA